MISLIDLVDEKKTKLVTVIFVRNRDDDRFNKCLNKRARSWKDKF